MVLTIFTSGALVFAVSTNNLFFYVNANDPGSYSSSTPTVWTDLSAANRNGTVVSDGNAANGSVTKVSDALKFPGNLGDYVDMGSGFNDFGTGITIEFEAHFGSTTTDNWERIFDFGNAAGVDNIWVGNYTRSGEVTIELWKPISGTQTGIGRCRTDDSVNAITADTFKKYVVTLDGSTCRIYIDGLEVNTVVDGPAKGSVAGQNSSYDSFYDKPADLGSPYPQLPSVVTRTKNYIGKSNWAADAAFDGAIKYVRIYTEALTPSEVSNNAATYTLTYSTTGSENGTAPGSVTGNGLITLAENTGNLTKSSATFLGWATSPNQNSAVSSPYNLTADTTLYPAFSAPSSGSGGNTGTQGSTPLSTTSAETLANTGYSKNTLMTISMVLIVSGVVFINYSHRKRASK